MMRALWLHYPDDPAAVARSDSMWGRDVLVAPSPKRRDQPQTLPAARNVRLLTIRVEGGREIDRKVDLTTTHCMCGPEPSCPWAR
jgi:alpha-glucosidase (family GH31 glycosyl hydrolase)